MKNTETLQCFFRDASFQVMYNIDISDYLEIQLSMCEWAFSTLAYNTEGSKRHFTLILFKKRITAVILC